MENVYPYHRKIIKKNPILKSKIVRFLRKYKLMKSSLVNSQSTYRHVLSVDIVGLSRKNLAEEEQVKKIEILNKSLMECEIYQKIQKNDMLFNPTGDGFLIGITDDLKFPIELAIQLQERLKEYNQTLNTDHQIKVRMGMHNGTSSYILGTRNEWGVASYGATRVMGFGESDHILLSSKMALELIQLSTRYKQILHPIGDYVAKHGDVYSLYSAFDKNFGNSKLPAKIVKNEATYLEEEIEITSLTDQMFEVFLDGLVRLPSFTHKDGRSPMSAQHFVNLFKLMRKCHLSPPEVINLKKEDFDFRNKIIMIRYSDTYDVIRTVPLPKNDMWIQEFLRDYKNEDFIFRIGIQTVYEYAKDAKIYSGIIKGHRPSMSLD